ncbi:hypothetical protein HZF09_25685 [Ramlibacter sp. CGMCC 1.13660]|nr:hypothetical protein [Ramlibacter sp. CGMCC 1.13660]
MLAVAVAASGCAVYPAYPSYPYGQPVAVAPAQPGVVYAPAPVVVAPPAYYAPPPVYLGFRFGYGYGGRYHRH